VHLGPVALGGKEVTPIVQPPLQEVNVGLLAGLQDASLDLMGGVLGDHPVGRRLRPVLGTEVVLWQMSGSDSSQSGTNGANVDARESWILSWGTRCAPQE